MDSSLNSNHDSSSASCTCHEKSLSFKANRNIIKQTSMILWYGVLLVSLAVFDTGFVTVTGQQLICENRNPEGHSSLKTQGDGGFQVIIVGPGQRASRGYYAPNDVYTVTIQGLKTRYSTQKFTEFFLVAESEKQITMGQSGLVTTGIFHIVDDTQTRFSDVCPDAVISSNLQPKTEISVLWTAPSILVASCVTFKVTLVERPQVWYMDDGQLTKTLCPEFPTRSALTTPFPIISRRDEPISAAGSQRHRHITNHPSGINTSSGDSRPRFSSGAGSRNNGNITIATPQVENKCCACDEAKYDIVFEGIWSRETHPKDFPENEWLLHFSDIIGASHSKDYHFWEVGKEASEGIRQVAEWGATRHLENELKSKSRHINTIIKARGLWHPNEKGQTSAAFRVDRNHHLMSLVSMIGPSPDWIVGIPGFELCMKNCTWLSEVHFDLFPYDAGTDSGITYMSPNLPTEPRGKIKAITATDPNDSRSPFYDPIGRTQMKPFARVHIRRQRIYPKNCSDVGQSDASHEILIAENTEDINRPECAVSDWTPWSDCSVACGKGLRMRKRSYMIPMKATMMQCDRQLIEKEMCLGRVATCVPDSPDGIEEIDSVCAVTQWSNWTPCSVSCGKGTKSRTRRYKNHMGRKKCSLEMLQSEMCVGIKEYCDPGEEVESEQSDPDCPLTPWSEWSPCSVTCGSGIRERSRFFLFPSDDPMPPKCAAIRTTQRASCEGEMGADCTIGMETAKEICMLPRDSGLCRANKLQFFFSTDKMMCVPFSYGGCKGNRNRFDTEEECNQVCGFLRPSQSQHISRGIFDESNDDINTNSQSNLGNDDDSDGDLGNNHLELDSSSISLRAVTATLASVIDRPVIEPENIGEQVPAKVDCIVTEWSEWSTCSVTCGVGHMTRIRMIKVEPQNDGRRCPRRLRKRRPCRMSAC